MSAKCSRCGLPIFDEDGQCYGTQQDGGTWLCDDGCDPELVEEFDLLKVDPLILDRAIRESQDKEIENG